MRIKYNLSKKHTTLLLSCYSSTKKKGKPLPKQNKLHKLNLNCHRFSPWKTVWRDIKLATTNSKIQCTEIYTCINKSTSQYLHVYMKTEVVWRVRTWCHDILRWLENVLSGIKWYLIWVALLPHFYICHSKNLEQNDWWCACISLTCIIPILGIDHTLNGLCITFVSFELALTMLCCPQIHFRSCWLHDCR